MIFTLLNNRSQFGKQNIMYCFYLIQKHMNKKKIERTTIELFTVYVVYGSTVLFGLFGIIRWFRYPHLSMMEVFLHYFEWGLINIIAIAVYNFYIFLIRKY